MFKVGQWLRIGTELWKVVDIGPMEKGFFAASPVTLEHATDGRVHTSDTFGLTFYATDYQHTEEWFSHGVSV